MATLRKLTTNKGAIRWEAQVRRLGHPPRSRRFRARNDAVLWAQETERRMLLGDVAPPVKVPFTQLITEYQEAPAFALLRESTRHVAKRRLTFWRNRLGSYHAENLTARELARIRDEMLREGKGPATVNRYLAVLSCVYRAVGKPYYGLTNAVRGIDRLREPPGRDRFLSDEEYEQLREACARSSNRQLLPMFQCALSCGARTSELLSMEKSALDLERGLAYLPAAQAKTGQPRVLAFHGEGLEALRAAVASSPSRRWVWGLDDRSAPVWPRSAWNEAVRRAGLGGVVWYTLRHTSATWKAMVGASGPEIAMHLGHSSLSITRRYVHLAQVYRSAVAPRFVQRVFAV